MLHNIAENLNNHTYMMCLILLIPAFEVTWGQTNLLIYNKIANFGLRGHSRPKSEIKNDTTLGWKG